MRIKLNKEIRDYTENVYFGLSIRQFIFSVCACLGAVATYFCTHRFLGKEISSWICVLSALPFAILGFVKYNGMAAEQLFLSFLKTKIRIPRRLLFENENMYSEILHRKEQV